VTDTAKRIGPTSIANTETTFYTCPAATTMIVKWARFANVTGTAATIRTSVGADAAGTRLLFDVSIPANDFIDLSDMFLVLNAAETLRATGGTNNAITITAGGVEIS